MSFDNQRAGDILECAFHSLRERHLHAQARSRALLTTRPRPQASVR